MEIKNYIGCKITVGIMKDRTNHVNHNSQTTSVSDKKIWRILTAYDK